MAGSCSELFSALKPHYNFLSWKVISFLSDCLKVGDYFLFVEEFERTVTLASFKHALILLPQAQNTCSLSSNCSEMIITLNKQWEMKSLFNLRGLNALLFASLTHVMSHLTVIHSLQNTVVKYRIPQSRKLTKEIQSVVLKKKLAINVLGIAEIAIDNDPVLIAGQQLSFTFESAAYNAVSNAPSMDSDELLKLLKFLFGINGVDPNYFPVHDKYTALHYAVTIGNLQAVNVLLDNGASPEIGGGNERITPLMVSSFKGYLKIVQILVNTVTHVNQTDASGRTALIYASLHMHNEIIKLLLQKGSDPNITAEDGMSALMMASNVGNTEIVQHLLEARANPNLIHDCGKSALMLASSDGHSEIVKLLLAHHADYTLCVTREVIPVDSFGFACYSGNKTTVDVFLSDNNLKLSPTSLSLGWYIACLYNETSLN